MIYSHSRLSTFEQCKFKFKLKYIDQVEGDIDNTVEAFMGSRVHDVLEKLYKDLMVEKQNELKDLLSLYDSEWKKHWTDKIKIVKQGYTEENYKQLGARCIVEYFERYKPFNQMKVLGCEIRVEIEAGPHKIQGYIDRLDCQGTHYYIHDYKTAGSLPSQAKLDEDRQLALYSIAIKEMYPECTDVTLVWHYLQFDKTVTSTRTDDQLRELRENLHKLIEEILVTKDFPTATSALCNWCEFKSQCPEFAHAASLENRTPEDFHKDDGVKLVDEYMVLNDKAKEFSKKADAVKDKIVSYSEQFNYDSVIGSDSRVKIWKAEVPSFPGKNDFGRKEFEEILKNLGVLEEVKQVDTFYLSAMIRKHELNPIVEQALLKKYPKKKVTRLYSGKR